MKKKEVILHRDLQEIRTSAYAHILLSFCVGLVTYWVRLFSYTTPGPLYGASLVLSITLFLIFNVYLTQVGKGKLHMNFKRSYKGILSIAPKMSLVTGVSLGIFLGNIAYYASRARIWSDPMQWLYMFKHSVNMPGLIAGAAVSLMFFLSLFVGERYIDSREYRKRMRYKTEIRGLKVDEAFKEIISEQDRFLEFGIPYEQMPVQGSVKKQVERPEPKENDPFGDVRVNRGGKQ